MPVRDASGVNGDEALHFTSLLPFYPDGGEQTTVEIKKSIPLGVVQKLLRYCSVRNEDPFNFLLAAYYAVICRYSEQRNLHLVVRDETHYVGKTETGMRTAYPKSTTHLLLDEGSDITFDSLLSIVKSIVYGHSKGQRNSSSDASLATFKPDLIQSPYARAYFCIEDGDYTWEEQSKGANLAFVEYQAIEIALTANKSDKWGVMLSLEYRVDLYNSKDMNRFLENYIAFLSSATTDFENSSCDIAMCGETELYDLKSQFWNGKFMDNPWGSDMFIDKFLQIVEAMPDAIALESSSGSRWTYAHLNRQAEHMKSTLKKKGITARMLVGILCEPSLECIAAILGVLLARCGYVPMDPDSPVDRLAFIADDCGLKHIVISESYSSIANAISARSSSIIQLISAYNVDVLNDAECVEGSGCDLLRGHDPFYVIYTSVRSYDHLQIRMKLILSSRARPGSQREF